MNLHCMLLEREAAGRPVTVGLIAHLNHADRQLAALLMEAVQAGLSGAEWDALLARIATP